MPGPWRPVVGPAGMLAVHVAGAGGGDIFGAGSSEGDRAPEHHRTPEGERGPAAAGTAMVAAGRCLVVCHGLPVEVAGAARTGRTFPALADRLAAESGWCVVTCCLRGVGPSDGDFSLAGWSEDLTSLIDRLAGSVGEAVWLAGFGTGGAVALCVAAGDGRVRGVATLGAPARFDRWAEDPEAALAAARRLGVVRDPGGTVDARRWAGPARRFRPDRAAAALAPRPLLVVHGADDDVVPVADARALVGTAPTAELRVLAGAGHRLRADPRAIALLLGWLERQGP